MGEHVCVIGAGRSGAVAAGCLADLGHAVCAVDVDEERVAKLRQGIAPFFEPGLDDVIQRNVRDGRLSFTASMSEGVPGADFVLVSVDTPAREDGEADLSSLQAAVCELASLLRENAVVVTRSTVPIGTNARVAEAIRDRNPDVAFEVVSNPEFLREGHAVEDFMRPDRIVIGANTEQAARAVARLYGGLNRPIVFADLETAEMIKYAANTYLAASVSFINEIANICERVGADVSLVRRALALDRRIGERAYLAAGIGFGGSCLPKDLRALVSTAERHGYTPSMLKAVREINEAQPGLVITQLEEFFDDLAGLAVGVLGTSFKADTFDLRSSPALAVIRLLAERGVRVRAFDPMAGEAASQEVGQMAELCRDAYSAAEGCDALVIATDHSEFRDLDLQRIRRSMKSPVLIDGRNLLDAGEASRAGFSYRGIGRARRGR